MGGWTVVLRGIRYRPGRSLMVLLLAAIATAATVLAPAYSRAAQQSVLTDGLAAAPANATGLRVSAVSESGEPPALESTTEAKVEISRLLAGNSLGEVLDPPVASADIETIAVTPAGSKPSEQVLARLAYRDDVCRHLKVLDGECPNDPGRVIISERTAAAYGVQVGAKLTLSARTGQVGTTPPKTRALLVAGIYQPRDANEAYWGRGGYFAAGSPDSESSLPRVDAVFVADEGDLTLPSGLPSVALDYRLRPAAVRLDTVARIRTDLNKFETSVNARQIQLSTALRGVLDDIDEEAAALGRTVPIVAVPLVLVCWFILFLLVAALTEERTPEVALAKLRGYSTRQAARFGRAETLALVVLAVPVGVAGGLVLVEVAGRTMLSPGVHVEPARLPVAVAAALALVVAYLAVRLASARALGRPVLALLRRVPERGRWQAGVADGAIVALAGASLAAAVSDEGAPLALIAPALLAVVAGILTARLLGVWSRLRVRGYARRGRVTGLLAHAQLARRHLAPRIMLVVTVAVALLSFAATAWDVAAQARGDVAADTIGADRVLLVGAADPVAFMAAVKGVGTAEAMPVVRATERFGGGTVEVLSLDSRSLAQVAVWRGHDRADVADLARRLRPEESVPSVVPVAISGPTPDDDGAATQFTFPALGETSQRLAVVDRENALPRAGNRAVLIDLDYAVRSAQRASGLSDNSRLRYEVWATGQAPADLTSRLAAAGLQILGEQSIAAERDRLSRGAPALGLRLYLLAGGAAVVLAVGAVMLTAYIGAGVRRYEFAALRVAGVRPRVLRRGLLREYGHLLGLPFLVGLAAGIAGAVLMLPSIPLVTVGTATGQLTYEPTVGGVLPLAVGGALAGLLIAVLVVLRLVRGSTPDRLRQGGLT